MLSYTRKKIIYALDFDNDNQAFKMAEELHELVGMVKVGLQLYTISGPIILSRLSIMKIPVFLDLKFYDIPNTVANAIKNFTKINLHNDNIKMLTVHAAGEQEMIEAAVLAAGNIDVIAVTCLTSMENSDKVVEYTEMALEAGAAGVVCSAHEVELLRQKFGSGFKIIVPGIRPKWYKEADDQQRTATPKKAIKAGADYIVIGRPITNSTSPKDAAYNINQELE